MSRSGVITTIKSTLDGVTSPTFQAIFIGEPLSLPTGDRVVASWFGGEVTKSKTLGNVLVTQEWVVRCYFRVQASQENREKIELEIWNACRSVQTAFRADSQLGGNCTDLEISIADVGWTTIGGVTFRALSFNLELYELEAEAIAP